MNSFVIKNKKLIRVFAVIGLVALLVTAPSIIKKIKEEKRAHDFYAYIMKGIDECVEENLSGTEVSIEWFRQFVIKDPDDRIERFSQFYEKETAFAEGYMRDVSRSIDSFTKEMRRSSHIINHFNESVTFDRALRVLQEKGYNIVPNIQMLLGQKKALSVSQKGKERALRKKKDAVKAP